MTTQELYELLSKQITEMDAQHTKQFEPLDNRLRNVEVGVDEIKGRKAGWESARNWIATGVALVALEGAIAVALWKEPMLTPKTYAASFLFSHKSSFW